MTRILICLLAALLSAGLAFADIADPRMDPVDPDSGGSGGKNPIIVGASLGAGFQLVSTGDPLNDACTNDLSGWYCSLINQSGQAWSAFEVSIAVVSDPAVTFCGTYLGFSCAISHDSASTGFAFTGGLLENDKAFQLNFLGWPVASDVRLQATAVPEPSAILLLATALGALGAISRRRIRV
ncbi:MAG: PEP-CTERM sorting domain-containing protein [Candidatus Solibacter sp.]|nr:PEP-CTERM sorting domain-containing protein [Candidatus Solibacter sp.]